MGLRVNLGCGATPTNGWINLDSSPSVLLANLGPLARVMARAPFLAAGQREVIAAAIASHIQFASATKLPLRDASVDVLYSSHMMEHLPRADAGRFLREAHRVLADGGVIRLVLPDLRLLARAYISDGDADAFVQSTLLSPDQAKPPIYRLMSIFWGERRYHQWMYDGASLMRLLTAYGFRDVEVLPPGKTTILDPGDLDLAERAVESVYVEARK